MELPEVFSLLPLFALYAGRIRQTSRMVKIIHSSTIPEIPTFALLLLPFALFNEQLLLGNNQVTLCASNHQVTLLSHSSTSPPLPLWLFSASQCALCMSFHPYHLDMSTMPFHFVCPTAANLLHWVNFLDCFIQNHSFWRNLSSFMQWQKPSIICHPTSLPLHLTSMVSLHCNWEPHILQIFVIRLGNFCHEPHYAPSPPVAPPPCFELFLFMAMHPLNICLLRLCVFNTHISHLYGSTEHLGKFESSPWIFCNCLLKDLSLTVLILRSMGHELEQGMA